MDRSGVPRDGQPGAVLPGGKACLLICKHDHFTPTREIKRYVRALACNHPEGWKLQGHFFFFFFTLVTGPRRSLSLKLSDTRVYEP